MNVNAQMVIDRQLLNACLADPIDYSLVESLLCMGADPMGRVVNKYGEHEIPENVYDLIVDQLFEGAAALKV